MCSWIIIIHAAAIHYEHIRQCMVSRCCCVHPQFLVFQASGMFINELSVFSAGTAVGPQALSSHSCFPSSTSPLIKHCCCQGCPPHSLGMLPLSLVQQILHHAMVIIGRSHFFVCFPSIWALYLKLLWWSAKPRWLTNCDGIWR